VSDEHLLISVPETEFKGLLDRDRVISDVNEQLKVWTHLMRDIVNYGTNLIPRCFGSSSRSLADAVVLGILLRQAVAMLDGAEVLLSNGAVHAAKLQMRALLEVSLYIHWILLSDTEKKADYYYVHNLRRKRLWAERLQGTSAAGQDFIAMMNAVGVPMSQEAADFAKQQTTEIDRVLAQPKFAQISVDFDNYRRGKGDLSWYVPLGPRNLRVIAKDVSKLAEYVMVYSGASEVMHGSNYEQHVSFSAGRISFTPIRYLKDFGTVYHFSVTFAFQIYRRILEMYRPGEIAAFNRKYLENWRRHYMNIPKVMINSVPTTI
jgi:Family of unknown function (DUF5677)